MALKLKKNNPGCKCCAPCNCISVVTTDCPGGGSAMDASYYTFSVSGLTDDDCASCDSWNGDWLVCWKGGDTWDSAVYQGTECGHTAGDPLWRLVRSGGFYNLQALGTGYYWKLATASWSCQGTNTLTLNSPTPVPAPCGSVPNTIELTPCKTCDVCSTGTTPSAVQLDISGILPAFKACQCGNINSTFILDNIVGSCHYRYVDDNLLGCPSYYNCPYMNRVEFVAVANVLPILSANWGWELSISVGDFISVWLCSPAKIKYIWNSGGQSVFDCSVARSMSYLSSTDQYNCGNWSGATITLTPL